MAVDKSSLIKIRIIGLITQIPYHRAKLCVQKLSTKLPEKFAVPEIKGLLDLDWDEYITKKRRLHGGQFWALKRSVAVFYNDVFIGSDIDLFEELTKDCCFLLPSDEDFYKMTAYMEYVNYLQKSKRVYCYMDIAINESYVGTLTFQLYSELLPETCEVFRCLCTGEMETNEDRIKLTYKDSQIHRIVKMCWIQGGDIENRIGGGGGMSILSPTFPDESYCISHDRRGVLSMANDGKHTNASQFFITLQPMKWMDQYYVAFGQLVEGVDTLKCIEAVESYYEMPMQCITIQDCGMITFEEKEILATLKLLLPREEREKVERLPPKRMLEYESDFSIRSSEKAARSIIKKLLGKTVGEEDSKLTLLSSEEGAISIIKELISKATTTSSEQISMSLVREMIMKATIKPPVDVLDERDVPSALDVQRYFEGMYSFEMDSSLEYLTPKMYISVPSSSFQYEATEEEEEASYAAEEKVEYYIQDKYSEDSLPVTTPAESSSDITLTSSCRNVAAIIRRMTTRTVMLDESAKRIVNRVLNDALRIVKISLNLQIIEDSEVLTDTAKLARNLMDSIEREIKSKYYTQLSTEVVEDEERFARQIVSEITHMTVPNTSSSEEIANSLIAEMMIKALDVCLEMEDPSSVLVAKTVISETMKSAMKDVSVLEDTSDIGLLIQSSFAETSMTKDSLPTKINKDDADNDEKEVNVESFNNNENVSIESRENKEEED